MNKHRKDSSLKETGLHLHVLFITPHSTMKTIGRICVFNKQINYYALPIIIIKPMEIQFSSLKFIDASS
jgi:hypothetical protein